MKPNPFFRLSLLLLCALPAAHRPASPPGCEPGGPVTVDAASLNEASLLALLTQHRPRYTAAEVETLRAGMDRCNTATADALNAIEVEKSGLSLRLQELLRFGDVVKLRERIETLRKNRESSKLELERNLAGARQTGLYVVLLEKVDIYAAQKDLRTQAQAALSPRAVSDLNGVFVRRATEAADLKAVRDIVQSFSGGEASEDLVLFDKTNFESGKDYYLYFAKISVRPLKKPPTGSSAPPPNATVLNLDIDKNYQTVLSAKGVIAPHLNEIASRAVTYTDLLRRENDDAARRRDNVLQSGQDELRRADRDIDDAERDLATRAGKIQAICRELALPYDAALPDRSAAAAAQKLRDQIAALETRWNQTKEQEIQYTDTKVTIEESPAKDFADEAVKLSRKLEQQYGKVQKTEEIVRVEDLKVTDLTQTREVELYRRLRRVWVYPVGESDGSFRLYVFGAFSIAGRKEAGGPVLPPMPGHMVRVEGGTFQMGDQFGDGQSDETAHTVSVSTFYLSKTEVTFEEYDAFCAATGREKPGDEGWGRGRRPVINVRWYDAVEYCNWLSVKEKLRPVYGIDKTRQDPGNQNRSDNLKWQVTVDWGANGYRLPTEAEWEYAAREGGRKVRFGNGQDTADPAQLNFDGSASYKKPYSVVGVYRGKTVPVEELSANGLGLRHMSGNVWEWCWDWYDSGYYGQSAGAQDPRGAKTGEYRVCRGGSWYHDPDGCCAADRDWGRASYRVNYLGFRVVRGY